MIGSRPGRESMRSLTPSDWNELPRLASTLINFRKLAEKTFCALGGSTVGISSGLAAAKRGITLPKRKIQILSDNLEIGAPRGGIWPRYMGILMERGPITIDCCTKILMKSIFQGVVFDYLFCRYVQKAGWNRNLKFQIFDHPCGTSALEWL